MSFADQVRVSSTTPSSLDIRDEARSRLNDSFSDLDFVLGHAGPSTPILAGKKGKRKRTLQDEISHWEREEAAAEKELAETRTILPGLLADAHTKLQSVLSTAQKLSVERYELVDKLSGLITELQSPLDGDASAGSRETLVDRMDELQQELARLEAGLAWATILEQAILLSERVLSPSEHKPSPIAALPHYRALDSLVHTVQERLPPIMTILRVLLDLRDRTWQGLRDTLATRLLSAIEAIKWPSRVDYLSASTDHRRTFEQAFSDLLYLDLVGEDVRYVEPRVSDRFTRDGLYPIQALIQPIALRFKYHFQGTKSTNRLDKPEWAFANILDQIYEHTPFLTTVIQPLTRKLGYNDVDIRSEFIYCLIPVLLDLLRSRIPKLLAHPALLAHTIYQTVLFDDAIRQGGFDIARTSSASSSVADRVNEWEGLVGILLKEEGWFDQWLAGEKRFVDGQLNEIISSADAWTISDETIDEDERGSDGRKPTVSARQVKALIEQITDRYSPLPLLQYRLPFLLDIQLPILQAYHHRINGSLDAFENLSSAFARAIPGALSGHTRSGVTFEQQKLTGGAAGLSRLIKANLSAAWIAQALREWSDDVFFVEFSVDLASVREQRWKFTPDPLIPVPIKEMAQNSGVSTFDVLIERYESLCRRSEEMIVKLVTVEVENELREHLKRRWDQPAGEHSQPSQHLLSALTTYSALLRSLSSHLAPIVLSRLYRQIVHHIVNHITQRAVYSGWSKFTCQGGQQLSTEINDFVSASTDILGVAASPANVGIEIPWRSLLDISKVLRLPTDTEGSEGSQGMEGATFSQAMAAAWSDGPETLRLFLERLGTRGMDRGELQAVLRRRVECWR